MSTRTRIILTLISITIIALIFRVALLGSYPEGFNEDEVAYGYVGRYTLAHGVDPRGHVMPLWYYDFFGEYPNIIPMYLSGAVSYIIGPGPLAVRLPAALLGSLFPLACYLLMRRLMRTEVAVLSAALAAITPWHVIMSRANAEGISGLTLYTLGLSLIMGHRRVTRITGSLLLLSTYFFYHSYRLITPLTLLCLCIGSILLRYARIRIPMRLSLRHITVTSLILIVVMGWIALQPWGRGRLAQVSILDRAYDREIIPGITSDAPLALRYYPLAGIALARQVAIQISSYITPGYLYFTGGLPQRYAVPAMGLLPLSLTIYLLASLVSSGRPQAPRGVLIALGILAVISLLPAAVTTEDTPNVHRSIPLILPLVMTGAWGIWWIYESLSPRYRVVYMILAALILTLETGYFVRQYISYPSIATSQARQDGNWQLALYLRDHHRQDHVVTTNRYRMPAYVGYAYDILDPSLAGRFGDNLSIDRLESVDFVVGSCASEKPEVSRRGDIVVDYYQCAEPGGAYELIHTVPQGRTGTTAYRVYRKM